MGRFASPVSVAVGLGAGLASALLFAALVGGTTLALPLFLVSALPIVIAALGWGPASGLTAVITSAIALGAGLNPPTAGLHAALTTVPAFVSSYLLGLARAPDTGEPAGRPEWFPVGRAVLVLAVLTALGTVVVGYLVGFGSDQLMREMERMLTSALTAEGAQQTPEQIRGLLLAVLTLMPLMFPISWTFVSFFNLWLGALVVAKSDRLPRPWEQCPDIVVPRGALVALVVLLVVVFVTGSTTLWFLAAPFIGALVALHTALGFAVLHALTRGSAARPAILAITWAVTLIIAFPAFIMAVLGIAEQVFQFRARRAARPPANIS